MLERCWVWTRLEGKIGMYQEKKWGLWIPNRLRIVSFWKLKFESEFQKSLDKLFFLIPERCEGTIVRQLATGRWGLPDHFEFCANSVLIFRLVWCFPILLFLANGCPSLDCWRLLRQKNWVVSARWSFSRRESKVEVSKVMVLRLMVPDPDGGARKCTNHPCFFLFWINAPFFVWLCFSGLPVELPFFVVWWFLIRVIVVCSDCCVVLPGLWQNRFLWCARVRLVTIWDRLKGLSAIERTGKCPKGPSVG